MFRPRSWRSECRRSWTAVNAELSRYEQIKRFRILPRDFSADEDEVTPTLKLKRRVVADHFADEIEELYTARAGERRRTTTRTSRSCSRS